MPAGTLFYAYLWWPDWKIYNGKLTSLDIMDAYLRVPLKILGPSRYYGIRVWWGSLVGPPWCRETLVSRTTTQVAWYYDWLIHHFQAWNSWFPCYKQYLWLPDKPVNCFDKKYKKRPFTSHTTPGNIRITVGHVCVGKWPCPS